MIKVIVFDLWDTLAYKSYKKGGIAYLWKKLGKHYTPRVFLKTFEKHFQLKKHISFETAFKKLFTELKIPYDEKRVKQSVKERKLYESKVVFYGHVFPLLKRLRQKGYKIGILSNTDFFAGERMRKTQLHQYVDKFFFSYEIGSIKPDPKNFRAVVSYFKVKPSEALMIGNNYQDDVVASRKVGMRAIHFQGSRALKKELTQLGVLP